METSLSEIKASLPGDVLKQLRNVCIFNMCSKEHFPDENSCIVFAQGFGLIPSCDSQILHCKGNFCRVSADRTFKVGFRFKCNNKKQHSKERCLQVISPLDNTFFKGTHFTIHDVFKLVMCFVSKLTVKQVVHQLAFQQSTVIGWYVSCREVCRVILANEFHGMIDREGEVPVDESHLYLWRYGLGRKKKWDDDDSASNEERDINYAAEGEYRRRYFKNMDLEPLPLDDQLLMFWYHIKLVFPGPGKVGLMYPITANVGDDSSHEVNNSQSMEATSDYSSADTNVDLPPKKKRKMIDPIFRV